MIEDKFDPAALQDATMLRDLALLAIQRLGAPKSRDGTVLIARVGPYKIVRKLRPSPNEQDVGFVERDNYRVMTFLVGGQSNILVPLVSRVLVTEACEFLSSHLILESLAQFGDDHE